jgi:hypothetical protein
MPDQIQEINKLKVRIARLEEENQKLRYSLKLLIDMQADTPAARKIDRDGAWAWARELTAEEPVPPKKLVVDELNERLLQLRDRAVRKPKPDTD